jgi:hypothetical protein
MAIDGAAWLGFGGVVAGAVLGYASSAAQETVRRKHDERRARQREQREDRVRFEDRRFDAYVEVITTANRVYAAVKYPAVARAELPEGVFVPITDPGAYLDRVHAAYAQFRTSLSPAFLMATASRTRDCMAALADAVRELLRGANQATGPGDGALRPLYYGHRQALRAAEAAMREEFGLTVEAPSGSS